MTATTEPRARHDHQSSHSLGWGLVGLVALMALIVCIEGIRGVYVLALPAVSPMKWFAMAILGLLAMIVSISAAAGPLLIRAADRRALSLEVAATEQEASASPDGVVEFADNPDAAVPEVNWRDAPAFMRRPPQNWPVTLKMRLAEATSKGVLTKAEWDVVTLLTAELAVISSTSAAGELPPMRESLTYAAWRSGDTAEQLRAWIRAVAEQEPPTLDDQEERGRQ